MHSPSFRTVARRSSCGSAWNVVHAYNGWEASLHAVHFRSVATWYEVRCLGFFSITECFSSVSRGIDIFEAWARQSTNSRSLSMDGTSLRSCVCCCHANLVGWSSFISIKEDMKDSKVSPIAVLSDRKCRLTKSWSCRNSLPVPVLTVGASTMVFTCFWWMNHGLSYLC